ncbi:MAG: hypothetical protein R6T83_09865 [Salinibacter sp.]
MSSLPDGKHMLSNVQWRRQERDEGLRPLRGFTTGTLRVNGSTARLTARFTDQNLSNRFSDLEEDGKRVLLHIMLLGTDEVYEWPAGVPSLERSGACYVLRVQGQTDDARPVHAA